MTGDVLVDPTNLAHTIAVFTTLGAKPTVSKIDLLHLQALFGGFLPDLDGNGGIDADIHYQSEFVERNWKELHRLLHYGKAKLSDHNASLSLVRAFSNAGLLSFFEVLNEGLDGLCYLDTGDPNRSTGRVDRGNIWFGEGSICSDVMGGSQHENYWLRDLRDRVPDYAAFVTDSSFSTIQMWTRLAALGRAARHKQPLITSSAWMSAWLKNSSVGGFADSIVEDELTLSRSLTANADDLSTDDVFSFVTSNVTQNLIKQKLQDHRRSVGIQEAAKREDWFLLVLNLLVGVIPIAGSVTTLCTTLYQKHRNQSTDLNNT